MNVQNGCEQFHGFCNGILGETDLMNYVEVYKTVLDFHRKYSNILNTEGYWDSVVAESDAIAKQYGNGRFVRDLLLAVIGELERKAKEMIKNADTEV